MKIIKVNDYEQMSLEASSIVLRQIKSKSNSIIIFPTGSTPKRMYSLLIKSYRDNKDDWSKVVAFNLDEYVGLKEESPFSYHSYMHNNFYDYINMDVNNIHIPKGLGDVTDNIKNFNKIFHHSKKPDLAILGIGTNGHIGFNEPGTSEDSIFRLVKLSDSTIKSNSKNFNNINDMPEYAMSMGIADILSAKKIIILANGKDKSIAMRKMINEKPTTKLPASFLQKHNDVTIILDEQATIKL